MLLIFIRYLWIILISNDEEVYINKAPTQMLLELVMCPLFNNASALACSQTYFQIR